MRWFEKDFSPGPRRVHGGIKARSERGEFAKNWWARRWLTSMENLVDVARLQRGRRYARQGQVVSMEERGNEVIARVQGSRSKPYKVHIGMVPLTDEQWNNVLQVLAERAIFAAQLLAGEMPIDIEEVFAAAGVSLFPVRLGDLVTNCSCPDWANPCKHVAAAHYILGDRFDEDPFLLFRLRGRTREQVLDGLRRFRSDQIDADETGEFGEIVEEIDDEEDVYEEKVLPLEEDMNHFWERRASLDEFMVEVKAPEIDLPIFRRLGEPDITGSESLEKILADTYKMLSQAAMIIAYRGEPAPEPENGDDN